ncbi:hypothetical protein ABJ851_004215 [Shigella flexneri]|nr:hypothetical protein [Escherichia coli]
MFYPGLTRRFKSNRPLSFDDQKGHVEQKKESCYISTELIDDMSFIKINSTFIEVVDPYYKDRGGFTLVALLFLSFVLYALCSDLYNIFTKNINLYFGLWVFTPLALLCIWGLTRESFTYTHFPIRFNRKKKLVHVFHVGGRVETYGWDELYFTIIPAVQGFEGRKWYLCAYRVAEDGYTVEDTFCVSMYSSDEEDVRLFWELIRRYMEQKDGARQAADLAWMFLPIAEKRESFMFGFFALIVRGGNWPMQLIMLPWVGPQALARWFSMVTSRIPHWPEEVEQECEISKTDVYRYDSHSPRLKKFTHYMFPWRLKEYTTVAGKKRVR